MITNIYLENRYQYVEAAKLFPGKYIDAYVERSQRYLQIKVKINSVALGRCTEAVNRCTGMGLTRTLMGSPNVMRILLPINSIAYSYESKFYPVLDIHTLLRKF